MTHARRNLSFNSLLYRRLLAIIVFAALSGCEGRAYPVTERTSVYVEEHLESLNGFADLILAEQQIGEVWCVPPALEARNKGGDAWFGLEGNKFEAYSEHCTAADLVAGVYMDDDSPVLVLPFIQVGHSVLHHELVRPASDEWKKQTCGPLSFFAFVDHCQMPLGVGDWMVRYRALSDEELEDLK